MKKFSFEELKEVVSYGGGLILNAENYSIKELIEFASYASDSNGTKIIIKNPAILTFEQLKEIASYGSGSIIFDLEENY